MMRSYATTVWLPGGYWLDGVCYQEAELRPVTGDDEVFLVETSDALLPVQRTTALLARCLTLLGPLNHITPELAASLTVGDREALLLHLRRLTLGERLPCELACPNSACGERMDVDLKVGDLLLPPYSHSQEWYERTISENGQDFLVRFRLPTGADQEEAARLARRDATAATDLLLRRCLASVTTTAGQPVESLPPVVAEQLPGVMAELDPQEELTLNVTCPNCGHDFSALLDAAAYFFQELADRIKQVYKEVHWLAFYYHWSEAEIMSMPHQKRRLYLDLLSEALSETGR
jgi:hypothetical protein